MESYDVEWKGRKNQSIFQVDSFSSRRIFVCFRSEELWIKRIIKVFGVNGFFDHIIQIEIESFSVEDWKCEYNDVKCIMTYAEKVEYGLRVFIDELLQCLL